MAIEGARARISQSDNWSQIHKVHSLLANLEYAFLRAGGELQPVSERLREQRQMTLERLRVKRQVMKNVLEYRRHAAIYGQPAQPTTNNSVPCMRARNGSASLGTAASSLSLLPFWVTSNVCPPIVRCPVRALSLVLAVTV